MWGHLITRITFQLLIFAGQNQIGWFLRLRVRTFGSVSRLRSGVNGRRIARLHLQRSRGRFSRRSWWCRTLSHQLKGKQYYYENVNPYLQSIYTQTTSGVSGTPSAPSETLSAPSEDVVLGAHFLQMLYTQIRRQRQREGQCGLNGYSMYLVQCRSGTLV